MITGVLRHRRRQKKWRRESPVRLHTFAECIEGTTWYCCAHQIGVRFHVGIRVQGYEPPERN